MKVNQNEQVKQEPEKKAEGTAKGYTETDVQKWKAQWGRVFKTVIDGKDYIWRKLRRPEYVELMKQHPAEGEEDEVVYKRQDAIAQMVVLFPDNIADLIVEEAGLATTISDEVIVRSGFDLSVTQEL